MCCCDPQECNTYKGLRVEVAYSVCCAGIVKRVVLTCKVCCINMF